MKYPNNIKITLAKKTNYANRGMTLEEDLNITNSYYINKELAFIYKKPTPIKVVKMEYTKKRSIIKEAYFEKPSTTDYNGLYNGEYIDFEAKETNSKTAFPIKNIHNHQIEHIKNIVNNDGICFIIVRFNLLDVTYLLSGKKLINFINNNKRSSIPISYFIEFGYVIPYNYLKRCDYLEIVKDMKGFKNEK